MKRSVLIFLGVVLAYLFGNPVMSAETGVGVIGPMVDDIDVELGRLKPDDTIPLARAFTI